MISLLGIFIAGIIFASGPCLASCGALLVSMISGTAKTTSEALFFYTIFSLSRILGYLVIGILVFYLGQITINRLLNFNFNLLASAFLGIIAILMLLGRNITLKAFVTVQKILLKGIIFSPFSLGLLYGFLPCVPFLGFISYLGLISKDIKELLGRILIFGLGTFCSPLLLLTILVGSIGKFIRRQRVSVQRVIEIVGGIILLILAIGLLVK
ncbi:MAG: sulfite exporter TauE/SafE family protein [Candidatus Omnitrophica bacterium]|nr:sulfite exporter TauE/SafE family protein [Candidatus Omnitrophota bacterium]